MSDNRVKDRLATMNLALDISSTLRSHGIIAAPADVAVWLESAVTDAQRTYGEASLAGAEEDAMEMALGTTSPQLETLARAVNGVDGQKITRLVSAFVRMHLQRAKGGKAWKITGSGGEK